MAIPALSATDYDYVVRHIFLPPKLPAQSENEDTATKSVDVLSLVVLQALETVILQLPPSQRAPIKAVIGVITNFRSVHATTHTIREDRLLRLLQELAPGNPVPLYVHSQNAGIVVSRLEDTVHFEAFELSPLNEAVYASQGRLRRSFPGSAVSISLQTYQEAHFQRTVAQTLAKMSHEVAIGTQPRVRKAGQLHDEDRDSTHPAIVTELFMSFLEAAGNGVDTSYITKNTREEVLWTDARSPWRRSPVWLLLRVVLQLSFSRMATTTGPSDMYKDFMVFLMSRVLKAFTAQALRLHTPPYDLLYAMNAKISRRLLKLGNSINQGILNCVKSSVEETVAAIERGWSQIQLQDGRQLNLSSLSSLDFEQDAFIALPALDNYIKSMSERQESQIDVDFQPVSRLVTLQADMLPQLTGWSNDGFITPNLHAFESWVASHLDKWIISHKLDANTCEQLRTIIIAYHSLASKQYAGNPETSSIMLLTIVHLWVACDMSAVSIYPLLKEYDPELSMGFAENLILPFKSQMERLRKIERYVEDRKDDTRYESSKLFHEIRKPDSFAARYFDRSLEHQNLLAKVSSEADRSKAAKLTELAHKKEEYTRLQGLANARSCDYVTVVTDYNNDIREERHSNSCQKCQYLSQSNRIRIAIHEWPLPNDPTKAKVVIFELQPPQAFSAWRDITVFLLLDVLKAKYASKSSARALYPLSEDAQLSRSIINAMSRRRISLLSEDKPHSQTHRQSRSVASATASDVCLATGRNYRYFDHTLNFFVGPIQFGNEILWNCTYKLPPRRAAFQKFLFRAAANPSGQPPNSVVASQSDCPEDMTLDEYKTLFTIPCGYEVQWPNILIQLGFPAIDFKKVDTTLLVLQCIYQAGPCNNTILRSGHTFLGEHDFAMKLLRELRAASERVRENWESSQALTLFICIASRLLSLNSSTDIQKSCIEFLKDTREIALTWIKILHDKAQIKEFQGERTGYMSKRVEIAMICADSFNVDDDHLIENLTLSDQASILVQCTIIVQESEQILSKASEFSTSFLYPRFRRLLSRCYSHLASNHLALDDAIAKFWDNFQRETSWTPEPSGHGHWITTTTKPDNNYASQHVHFDVLNGEILVNGLPLDNLPRRYRTHPMYDRLFGPYAIKIAPSTVPGMEFDAKRKYADYSIHFGMHRRADIFVDDLLIRAYRDDKVYELIPADLIDKSFPIAFSNVKKYIHWYDCQDGVLEFRPANNAWDASCSGTWRLVKDHRQSKWRLTKDGASILALHSPSSRMLSGILSPLAGLGHIHIVSQPRGLVEVEIPKLQMGYSLQPGESKLRSREFPKMSVDNDQSLGTLIGLRNKLLLKHEHGNRMVLLLDGLVSYCPDDNQHHVRVNVDNVASGMFHTFRVDDQLGRLIGNGSLHSELFVAYLHALTSFCLPDSLTQMTGTEKALTILSSATVRSFDQLTQDNVNLLSNIAALTPKRGYYPANEQVMQTVKWSPVLSYLSQHGGFYAAVEAIFAQAKRSSIFYPDSSIDFPDLIGFHKELMQRDSIRTAMFRVSGFGAEDFTDVYDAPYQPRDRRSLRYSDAFVISRFVYQNKQDLHWSLPLDTATYLWNVLSSPGPSHLHQTADVPCGTYSATLLDCLLQTAAFPLWIKLNETLKSGMNKFGLMIWFATLAYAPPFSSHVASDMIILQTLALFCTNRNLRRITPPTPAGPPGSFRLAMGKVITANHLQDVIKGQAVTLINSPDFRLPKNDNESRKAFQSRRQRNYSSNVQHVVDQIIQPLVAQWPCANPISPNLSSVSNISAYLNVSEAMKKVRPEFQLRFDNLNFFQYLQRIAGIVSKFEINPIDVPALELSPPSPKTESLMCFVSIEAVFAADGPNISEAENETTLDSVLSTTDQSTSNIRLPELMKALITSAKSQYEQEYVENLQDSIQQLQISKPSLGLHLDLANSQSLFERHAQECKSRVESIYKSLLSAVSPYETSSAELNKAAVAWKAKQWPRLSPVFFLQQLNQSRWLYLSRSWKDAIVRYGLAHTALQRARRLVNARGIDLINELRNTGHTNWTPTEFPDSLLLEVESGIMIREVQEQIASQMRDPQPAENSVVQLNMGEGKSSLIVPIVAACLADGTQLVRVIAARPQFKQMAQMLIAKLGGMLNRRVTYMPFSRAVKCTQSTADAIGDMLRECMSSGGILLVQPEHILSFRLMGLESIIGGKESIGGSLIDTQDFFDQSARDLVDESDENFSPKFELIYTIGTQQPVDSSPGRWLCTHEVLGLVKRFSQETAERFPGSLELSHGLHGRFPRTRILKQDAQDYLFDRVVTHICNTGLGGCSIARQSDKVRRAVFAYITKFKLTASEIALIENSNSGGFWTDSTRETLLLLRGLFAAGVLSFAFRQKRWRVNYGLDSSRKPGTKLAVPYRAKDKPSSRSEFSHPDVIIVLTTLSYYYSGLGEDDLLVALDHLSKADQANVKYQAWVEDADGLKAAFTQLEGINLRDRHQFITELFPSFQFSKATVNYFLANIVFPKEMKEFQHKLAVSGWDTGKKKTLPITGFSGTNDSRTVLPLGVKQIDLQEQMHTNALVLDHLLQPDNSVARIPAPTAAQSNTSDAERLLDMVMRLEPPVRVILDVGAQIIELNNLEVATRWLEKHALEDVQAAVFFNDNDELSVVNRNGSVESLQTSSFATQLNTCLVFLDQSHTRGTDLQLPEKYRAAVTLGAGLTKDMLVQACMRMRKLGKGQTVVFCVSEEIRGKILECTSKPFDAIIEISDILQWTITETWADTQRSIPLWALQGERFILHNCLWEQAQDSSGRTILDKAQAEEFLEDEAQTLEKRYRPSAEVLESKVFHGNPDLDKINQRCLDFGNLRFHSSSLQEEQERELSPEIEQERQVQRPATAKPLAHHLHAHLKTLVATGSLPAHSSACMFAFDALCETSAATFLNVKQFHKDDGLDLLVSVDFAKTVHMGRGPSPRMDSFQRPVQWILTSLNDHKVEKMVIISPYEAQQLLPMVRKSSKVALHLYTPRCNRSLRTLDDLDFFTVPSQPALHIDPRLVLQLNLFSGQLYINTYADYCYLCDFLGLCAQTTPDGWQVDPDGFISRDEQGRVGAGSGFTRSPVKFLEVLLRNMRRNGEEISKTDMGKILEGQILHEADFQR